MESHDTTPTATASPTPNTGRWSNVPIGDSSPFAAAQNAPAANTRSRPTWATVGGESGSPRQPHDDSGSPRTRATATNAAKAMYDSPTAIQNTGAPVAMAPAATPISASAPTRTASDDAGRPLRRNASAVSLGRKSFAPPATTKRTAPTRSGPTAAAGAAVAIIRGHRSEGCAGRCSMSL